MRDFNEKFEVLLELWDTWNELSDEAEDETWQKELISLEKTISGKVREIIAQIEDPVLFFRGLNIDLERHEQFALLHLTLSIADDGVFDKKLILIDFLKELINTSSKSYYRPIGKAVTFCDTWVQELIAEILIKSDDIYHNIIGLEVIANTGLDRFKSHCVSMLLSITNREFKEDDKPLLTVLLKTIVATRATTCIPTLERLLDDKVLQQDQFIWQPVLFTLVQLNSRIGWDRFKTECETKGISPEYASLLGQYGNKKISQFIQSELNKTSRDDWREQYLYALGKLGDIESLETIINYVSNQELDIIESSLNAFYTITGVEDESLDFDEFDCEEKDCKTPLLEWLRENLYIFDPNIRYFDGKPFSFNSLIDNLVDPNIGTRMEAIDSLRNYTNINIPYNPSGFVTNMLSRQREWQESFSSNKSEFPDGHWYMAGKRT